MDVGTIIVGQNAEKPTRQAHGWPLTRSPGGIDYFTPAKNKNNCHMDHFTSAFDFVTAKAPRFSKIQQRSISMRNDSARITWNPQSSAEFNKVRHLVRDQEAGGSNPLAPTILSYSARPFIVRVISAT